MLRNLRDFGFGKSTMEDSLHEEIQKLVEFLKPNANKPFDLKLTVNITILNALWAILTGEKLSLDHPKANYALKCIDSALKKVEGPVSAIANMLPMPRLLLLPGLKQ